MIDRVISQYRLHEQFNNGTMGVVYRARDERDGRDVVIKLLPPARLGDKGVRAKFRKEAQVLARLRHPNLLAIQEYGTDGELEFLAMEPFPGETLADRLRGGRLGEEEAVGIAMQVAAALEAVHRHRVVHRDLKPASVFLLPGGKVKVAGFGLAPLLHPLGAAAAESADSAAGMAGTLPYMAPEQLRSQAVTRRTDVYAFGTLLYEMMAGRRAFPQPVLPRLTEAILRDMPLAPSALVSGVSPGLERVVLKCLAKMPGARYRSGKEVASALRRLGATDGEAAPLRESPLVRLKSANSSHWFWLAAVVTLIAILAALFA